LFYSKTNYEVSTPISLKTNNKKPSYVIEHLHICVFCDWKQTHTYIQYIKSYIKVN